MDSELRVSVRLTRQVSTTVAPAVFVDFRGQRWCVENHGTTAHLNRYSPWLRMQRPFGHESKALALS